MNIDKQINEILDQPRRPTDREVWKSLDRIIEPLSEPSERIKHWDAVLKRTQAEDSPTGHPHFRLGILYLVNDNDEATGIAHLEDAYKQDQQHSGGTEPHRMAAYRVLSLVKDFLADLRTKNNWQSAQLEPHHRRVLISTLLAIYDATVRHILDMQMWTYSPFFSLVKDDGLRRFAGENYFCAQALLEWVGLESGQSFLLTNEYPFARALVGLYGGVLEAILADILSIKESKTLGQLIWEAHRSGFLPIGSRLCALATILLYFRNHIHANRDVARTQYFVDINVARELKASVDLVIGDLLANAKP